MSSRLMKLADDTYDFYDIKHAQSSFAPYEPLYGKPFCGKHAVLMVVVFKHASFHNFIMVFRRIFRENGDNSVLDTHVDDIANMVD